MATCQTNSCERPNAQEGEYRDGLRCPTSFLPPLSSSFPPPGLAEKMLQGGLGEAISSLRGHAVHRGQCSAREQSTGGKLSNPVKATLFREPFVK